MAQSDRFDKKIKSLVSQHARTLDKRLEKLLGRVQQGSYNGQDLDELASILKSIRNNITGNDVRLEAAIGIPAKTIAAAYAGKSRPRFPNFLKMIHGARKICYAEIQKSPEQQNDPFAESWQADWRNIDQLGAQKKISSVVRALEHLVQLAKFSNSAGESGEISPGLSELQRKQLIAILETALAMLKSPMVETGMLGRLGGWLKKVSKSAIDKKAESGFSKAAQDGFDAIKDLLT